ncbi:L,D-transpeptidase family protein [Tropicimonas sp. TH_r6]|uniref:L,D-transpeptidase family protein n=1 Tax=Tropicimonas sp. TH_r6 TaxID=3082085 RepID=UPI002954470D|nr:L,D-transpeptidase family protein [Tropicimonas sp. TH_r6]MDV7145687.1 L,D-transpeptidase family protein [Tropicimonas sp. TH_r6]
MIGSLATVGLTAAFLAPAGVVGHAVWQHYAPWDLTPPRTLSAKVDRIVIDKGLRTMAVYRDGQIRKRYSIALGFAPDGDKLQQGDGKTPEGIYRIDRRNAQSSYHLSLGIDYPRAEDRAEAAEKGVSPGGDIFIHGQPNSVADNMMIPGDWTAGCVALTNAEIQELFKYTPVGTEVEIRP